MKFTKMNALGNDLIIINAIEEKIKQDYPELAKSLCRRKYGIGGDGIVILEKSSKADIKMVVYNPDGSESSMSINGAACAARYAFDHKMASKKGMTIETQKRVIKAVVEDDVVIYFREPILGSKEIPMLGDKDNVINEQLILKDRIVRVTALSLDNPHCVVFVDNLADYPFAEEGKIIENHESFPKRTNVEFVQVNNEDEITIRVWERGVGTTLSCGTGACAAAVAGVLNEKTKRNITVHMPGGDVKVEWDEKTNHIKITGSVDYNFRGEIDR